MKFIGMNLSINMIYFHSNVKISVMGYYCWYKHHHNHDLENVEEMYFIIVIKSDFYTLSLLLFIITVVLTFMLKYLNISKYLMLS